MIHEEKLPDQYMPRQLYKPTPDMEGSPKNSMAKNFIQRNKENLKYLKQIERRPWSQAGYNQQRPGSMQSSYRGGAPIFSNGFIIQRGRPVIITPNLMSQDIKS